MKKKLFLFIVMLNFISCARMSPEERYQSLIVSKESGKLKVVEEHLVYKRSKKNYVGRYVVNYDNGKVKSNAYYLEGKKEGKEEEFYENGKMKSERDFINGEKEGEEITYFLNGDIKSKTNYTANNKNGKEIIFSKGKESYIITNYLLGKKKGSEKEYKKGVLIRETEFINSLKNGKEIFYKNGNKIEKRNYKSGKLLSYEKVEYLNDNKKISYFKGNQLVTIEIYEKSRLIKKIPYKYNIKNGKGYEFKGSYPYEIIYSNGDILEKKELLKEANYNENIKFSGALPERKYVLITSNKAIPKKDAYKTSERLKEKVFWGEKYTYLGETKKFYKISCYGKTAYITKKYSILRRFDFNKMVSKLKELNKFIETSPKKSDIRIINHYINPTSKKNDQGERDSYGSRGEQAAIAYYIENKVEKFRYIHDRQYILITGKDEEKGTISFKLPGDNKVYKTLKNEVTKKNYGDPIKKAIIIDKKNQNQGVFEKVDGIWELVSYSYINSGRDNGEDSYKTPSGEYSIAYGVPFILFLSKEDDGNDIKANFGIRFSGGGYIHTIPYAKKQDSELKVELKTIIAEGEKKLGIYPTTHKCVRNPQDHGKFLYEWLGAKKIRNGRYRIPEENSIVISY
ncbi:L,D-transpeptidase family protein [Psychrilyobacter atlanticus]|uniref:L,D-transpeptidase family protein n=1 Tax=Psychrilyobacter atlanticus TaxID=271091 RepID=UPI0004249D37|nr:L,D-transpeptidase family protein [Psychrilyobacter atlanticus]